ncbi:hypothetical protein QA600_20490 [Natronococcus sp. A-GB1]|uniref:hypothetical protein n=1 Tax=Natronococcus sp. A-GB1 TaxID=3037648 RepID=UPI00241C7FD2|nr:hypothetical protein [Natronococcus sp. A-GB1]MDG5761706.1 hypothetical protein [Natronococcus sp. A-GB1]
MDGPTLYHLSNGVVGGVVATMGISIIVTDGSSLGAGLMAVGGSGLFLFAASQLLFSDDPADSVPNSGGIGLAVLGAVLVCLGALLQLAT